MVQPNVVLGVHSPAHSFTRLVTPGKLHSPTAGTSRFGKISLFNKLIRLEVEPIQLGRKLSASRQNFVSSTVVASS